MVGVTGPRSTKTPWETPSQGSTNLAPHTHTLQSLQSQCSALEPAQANQTKEWPIRESVQASHRVDQRAENGGSDPSWLNLAFLGRPDFQSRGPKTL